MIYKIGEVNEKKLPTLRDVLSRLRDSRKHRALYCALSYAARPAHVSELYGQISTADERASLRTETARVTKDLKRATRAALVLMDMSTYSDEALIAQAENSFGGRFTIKKTPKGMQTGYTAGQCYPTEFRAAVATTLEDLAATLRRGAKLQIHITGTPSAALWREVGISNGYRGFDVENRKAWGTKFVSGFYRLPLRAGTFVFITLEGDRSDKDFVVRLGSDAGLVLHPSEVWPKLARKQQAVFEFGAWPKSTFEQEDVVTAVADVLSSLFSSTELNVEALQSTLMSGGEDPCGT